MTAPSGAPGEAPLETLVPPTPTPRSETPAARPTSDRSRRVLDALLDVLIDEPEREAEVRAEVDEVFGVERAVVVLDMSGFTRTTQEHGIVAFLAMVRQMHRLAVPAVEGAGGRVVKAESDDLWCTFDDVPQALAAVREVRSRLDAANVVLPSRADLSICVGIGWGRILDIDGCDFYGDAVNVAAKLGEDVAEAGEVLLSREAAARVPDLDVEERRVVVSNLELVHYAARLTGPVDS